MRGCEIGLWGVLAVTSCKLAGMGIVVASSVISAKVGIDLNLCMLQLLNSANLQRVDRAFRFGSKDDDRIMKGFQRYCQVK